MNKLIALASSATLLVSPVVMAAAADHLTVFVTSKTYDSNLGGLTGADAKCQKEADDPASIVPSGTYRAWLSDGTNSPNSRFTRSSSPYVLANGKKIAENYSDLTDGSLLNPINLGPNGKPVGYQPYWTGTYPDGSSARIDETSGTCGAWAVDPPAKTWGMNGHTSKKSGLWTTEKGYPCRKTLKLACFQQ
jgi:hypothetical protein